MKRFVIAALIVCSAAPVLAETSVGVSVGIHQPGVYGRIDFGSFPQPAVIYSQPIIIAPQPRVVRAQSVYLYVPPGHQKNWAKHCSKYGACGQPVFFVQESWVRERYEMQQHRGQDGHGKKEKKHKG
jgi:hypothetical protein